MKNPNRSPIEFFNLLSIESGIIDISAVKQMYNGLLRLVRKELRVNDMMILPGICKLSIRVFGKSGHKMFLDKPVPPYKVISIIPDTGLKDQMRVWKE